MPRNGSGVYGPPAGTTATPNTPIESAKYNAYVADKPSVPKTLREARDLFADSELARQAFGAEVVDHYTNMATVELDAFDAAVTDWERFRGFERL